MVHILSRELHRCRSNMKKTLADIAPYRLLNFYFTALYLFQLAASYGVRFYETSAKSAHNVENAFLTLARDIKVGMERNSVSAVVD